MATVRDALTGETARPIQILDASGVQITTFGGGTQYAEAATAATATGTALFWKDTGNAMVVASASKPLPSSDATAQGKLDTIITLLGTSVATQVWKSYNSTSSIAAGSAATVWQPASGKKIAITHLTIATYGTTAARVFLFFAASADNTYTAGTDQAVFVGSFAPSSSSYPGVVLVPPSPILSATADYYLKYQNDAALSIDLVVYGYEF